MSEVTAHPVSRRGLLVAPAVLALSACCPDGDPAKAGRLVVLLDFSDRDHPRPEQIGLILGVVRRRAGELPQHSRLVVIAMQSSSNRGPSSLDTLLDVSKPKAPTDANPMCETIRVITERWNRTWKEPLDKMFAELPQRERREASNSPLLASLKTICDQKLLHGSDWRTLLLVSDLREHSEVLSTYPKLTATFAQLKARNAAVLDVDFSGVSVEVHKLGAPLRTLPPARPAAPQQGSTQRTPLPVGTATAADETAIEQFWRDYARHARANIEIKAL